MNTSKVPQIVTEGSMVRIIYRDCHDEITERVIQIERIWVAGNNATCVMAHCFRRGERRTFDMARIIDAMPDESTTLRTFTAEERLAASTARLMAAHRAAIIASEQNARGASQWAGWS